MKAVLHLSSGLGWVSPPRISQGPRESSTWQLPALSLPGSAKQLMHLTLYLFDFRWSLSTPSDTILEWNLLEKHNISTDFLFMRTSVKQTLKFC